MSSANLQRTPPTSEQIALCAYLLWEKEGRPRGRELVNWLQAEEQLMADFAQDAGLLQTGPEASLDIKKLHRVRRRRENITRFA
jgi:hypothetical protein